LSVSETRRQKQNIARLHGECELNYLRLKKLLPSAVQAQGLLQINFSFEADNCKDGASTESAMRLQIVEETRYTSLVIIGAIGARPEWLPGIEVKVRLYHDAKMAEVIEWCSDRTIPWELVEKSGMQSRDEKWQWNRFLSDLLSHSLSHGMAKMEV